MDNTHMSWTEEEDRIILKNVLEFLKLGKTRVASFKASSEEVQRPYSAVAYHWNAVLAKTHKEIVREAQKEGRLLKIEKRNMNEHPTITKLKKGNTLYLEDVIRYVDLVEKENKELKEKLNDLHLKGL